MLRIEIADRQNVVSLDRALLRRVARHVLRSEGIGEAAISLAFVDDREMADLHVRYLGIAGPTDVITFPLSEPGQPLEGEVVVDTDEATRAAGRFGGSPWSETLLYVVHGLLHLSGYDDRTRRDAARMRRRQTELLAPWGVVPVYAPTGQPARRSR